jgi:hypothetical protein
MAFSDESMSQWHRVHLGFARIVRSYQPNSGVGSDEAEYDVRSFLIHAHHLADYLSEFDDLDPRAHVRSSPALALCRDLAVNFKHARMRSAPHTLAGDEAQIPGTLSLRVHLDEPGGRIALSNSIGIETASGSVDALHLAKGCVRDWIYFGLPRSGWPSGGIAYPGGSNPAERQVTISLEDGYSG